MREQKRTWAVGEIVIYPNCKHTIKGFDEKGQLILDNNVKCPPDSPFLKKYEPVKTEPQEKRKRRSRILLDRQKQEVI
jgi:hypothetical protein